jgi:hypothetical protein
MDNQDNPDQLQHFDFEPKFWDLFVWLSSIVVLLRGATGRKHQHRRARAGMEPHELVRIFFLGLLNVGIPAAWPRVCSRSPQKKESI